MDHKPYIRYIENSKYAVLFVHGIAGSPVQFRGLYPSIPEDWSVYNILLPGHDGSVLDFGRSSMAAWKAFVEQTLSLLLERHEKLLFAAHSMGTLFAIDAAIKHKDRIAGLFLLQVPLAPQLPLSTCCSCFRAALGVCAPGSTAEAMVNSTGLPMTKKLWQYLTWIPRFWELLQLIPTTKKQLPLLCVPTLAFPSQKDELVRGRACRYLQNIPCIRTVILPDSGHYAYSPKDLRLLNDHFREMVLSIEKQPSD